MFPSIYSLQEAQELSLKGVLPSNFGVLIIQDEESKTLQEIEASIA